jgi:chemotaxis protein MotB
MRGGAGRRHREEEEESVFISMTDMTVSFLFIIIILLIFFASQFSPDQPKQGVVPQSEFEEIKARLSRTLVEKAVLTEANQALILRNDELRTERDGLQARIVVLSLEIDTLETEVLNLKEHIGNLTKALAAANARIAALQSNLDELTEDNVALADQVTSLKQDIVRLTAEKSALSKDLARAEARIDQLQAQLATRRPHDFLEQYFATADTARTALLNRIRDRIIAQFPELSDIVTVENGALRFQSDRGLFAKSVSTLRPDRRALVDSIAETLDEVLPCYTAGPRSRWSATCNANFAMIEAVQIEGHTDSDGADLGNAILAANRALNTYQRMTRGDGASILDHRNLQGQPVLSLAAYGENRPIRPNDGTENKSANRRIDLRFIMVAPQRVEGIDRIRGALREGSVR